MILKIKQVINRILWAVKRRYFKILFWLFTILPVKENKISIASDSRAELNGNLYFIYEELHKRDLNLNIQFILNNKIDNNKSFKKLLFMAYHFATSKIILLDDFYPLIYLLKIRKSQDLIQVWHAAGAFKTFGFSRLGKPGGPSPKSKNHKNYTKAVVSSENVAEHYAEGFGINIKKIYPVGVPRTDVFFDEKYKKYVEKTLYKHYPQFANKKVILFAPTFRGKGQSSAYYPFEKLNLKELYDALHEEYVFVFKIHPFVNNKLNIPNEYKNFYYDLSNFREINDLLLVTDILITDYSSVCFEYALLNKPMLFFSFDVEDYIKERDFYYNYYDFIPGPLIRSTLEIIEKVRANDYEKEKIHQFIKTFFNENLGKASSAVVEQIIIPSLNNYNGKDKNKINKNNSIPNSRFELFDRSINGS